MGKLNLTINTPRGTNYEEEVAIITLRTSEGYIGIMSNRLAFISSVKVGKFTLRKDESSEEISGVFSNGIIQSEGTNASIIVKDVIWSDEVNPSLLEKDLINLKEKYKIEDSEFIKLKLKEQIDFHNIALEL